MNRDIRDTPGHECRPDTAQLEALEGLLVETGFDIFVVSCVSRGRCAYDDGGDKR